MALGEGGGGDLGRLIVRITADLSELKEGLGKAQTEIKKGSDAAEKATKGIVKATAGAAIAIVGFMTSVSIATSQYAVEIEKLSRQSGIATDELQRLGFAAKLNQSSVQELSTGLRIMANNLSDAARGLGEAGERFRSIGVSVNDTTGKLRPLNDVLLDVADVFQKMPDGAQKSALAVDLFGRSGTNLIPLLSNGRAGIKALGDEAERLGIVLSKDAVKRAAEFNDAMDKLRASFQGLSNQLGTIFIPLLTFVVNLFSKALGVVNNILSAFDNVVGLFVGIFSALGAFVVEVLIIPLEKVLDILDRLPGKFGAIAAEARQALGEMREGVQNFGDAATELANDELRVLAEGAFTFIGALNQAGPAAQQMATQVNEAVNAVKAGFEQLNQQAIQKFGQDFGTMANFVRNLTVQMGNAIITNLSSAISNVILGTQTAAEAFAAFGKALVKALVDFVVQYIITQVVTRGLALAAAAFATTIAAVLAQAWAVPAFLASVATLGGAVGTGSAALATGTAGAQALAKTASTVGVVAAAEGTVVDRPTLILAGEKNEAEAVVPLERPGIFGGSQFGRSQIINLHYYGGKKATREELEEMAIMLGELTQDQTKRVAV